MQKLTLLLVMGVWAMPGVAGGWKAPPVESPRATPGTEKSLWRTSVAVLVAANVMDARSSWGKYELNPSLSGNNGRFGRQGALLKLGIVGGTFVLESWLLRHQHSARFYRRVALVNFGSAAVTGATAFRNLGVRRP